MKLQRRLALTRTAPLPVRDGIAPSRVYLPPGPWPTIFDFLIERFPHMPAAYLRERLEKGDIVDQAGHPQAPDTLYRRNQWLWYYRWVPAERPVPFDMPILYRDDHLVVVDKPHFLASTPGGRHLHETALTRLRVQLDLPELSPIHRLDRETAGVMVFCAQGSMRGTYQSLFQARVVEKVYEAVAPACPQMSAPVNHRSRLVDTPDSFTMMEAPGPFNSETFIEQLATHGDLSLYRLQPITGRKHQLRVHMNSLGLPIINDDFYPVLQPYSEVDDFDRPLQLLARAIAFPDPITGRMLRFESQRQLKWFSDAADAPRDVGNLAKRS